MKTYTSNPTAVHANSIGAGFLKDLLEQFSASCPTHRPLFQIALCYDLSCPSNRVPVSAYRDAIDWIVCTYGEDYLQELGERIGHAELFSMREYGLICDQPEAEEICNALSMIFVHTNGACGSHGLQLIGADDNLLLLETDLPFHRLLTLGILRGLLSGAGYVGLKIERPQPTLLELKWQRREPIRLNPLYGEPTDASASVWQA